jgi:hypothetical protein
MSHNNGVGSTPPSRRSVVKGAAWAVPAVAVAAAAPTVAASVGLLEFTGKACKLPGNANDIFKGYVFELRSFNAPGTPLDVLTVISNVRLNGVPVTGFQVYVIDSNKPACSCACAAVGATVCNSFCTPEGATQRLLIYTNSQVNSQNTNMSLDFKVYDCGTCNLLLEDSRASGPVSTPPATGGGGSCNIVGAVPAPALNPICAGA